MRHGKHVAKLGKTYAHRNAMLKNMTTSLLTYECIRTTVPKAKELRRIADHMITLAKNGDPASKSLAYSYVTDKTAHDKLFNDLAPRYKDRFGGYTRIIRDGHRRGDNAEMCIIEYIDRPGELRQPRPAAPPSPAKSNYHYDGIKMLFEEDVPQNTLVSKTKGAHAQEPVEEAGEPKQHKEKHHKGDKSDPAKEAKDDKHKAEKSKEEKPKEEKPKEEKHEAKKESKEHEKPKK